MTKGKNVVVFDDLSNWMIRPHNPEIGVWKENVQTKPTKRVKPMSAMLIEKCQWQLEEDWRYRVTRGIKRDRFFVARNRPGWQDIRRGGDIQGRLAQHSTDWEPGVRPASRFSARSGSSNLDCRSNHPDVLHDGEGPSRRTEQTNELVMMVGLWACRVSAEISIGG
jgi:hypothetical protein